MSSDLRQRLQDSAGAPRFEVPVDDLVRRATRARQRAVAVGSVSTMVVVAALAVAVWSWWPDPSVSAPVIEPGPTQPADDDTAPDGPAPDGPASPDDGVDGTVEPEQGSLAAALAGLEWVTMDADGLRGDDGRVVWDGAPSLFGSVERDHVGGIAFTDEAGLWWWPSDGPRPRLVRADVTDVWRIDLADGVPVAVTDLGDVALSTGELSPTTNVDDPRDTTWSTITAANGLTARLTEIQAELDDETSLIMQVQQHVELVIERDGEPLASVVVGVDREPLVRLEDFDGRRVVITRTAEEPAMAPESLVAIDLSCADCVEVIGTAAPVTVALVGDDVSWDGPVEMPNQGLVTPLTTDDDVRSLPDGRHLLVEVDVADDGASLSGDLAIWFSGEAADVAAIVDGSEDVPVPNDYYLRNLDPARLSVELAPDVEVTSVWFHADGGPTEPQTIAYEQFLATMRGEYEGNVRDNLRTSLWWVTLTDGEVVALEEQYVP